MMWIFLLICLILIGIPFVLATVIIIAGIRMDIKIKRMMIDGDLPKDLWRCQ